VGGVYVIRADGELVELVERAYDSEDLLQELLAKYPALLAGDQMDSAAPRRWVLISREVPIPGEEAGGDRWSVDHLLLDQDAVPTLVEVKRSSDSRIRREVIGQMLDYAANAVVFWPPETARIRFESRCEKDGRDPQEVLAEALGVEDVEGFWQRVKTNLQAGRVRLVFVADVIPMELRRIVEFLNGQMDPAEVLAVEIRQYVGEGLKSLVPRVFGQTAGAQAKKAATGPAPNWDRPTFLQAVRDRLPPDQAIAVERVLDASEASAEEVGWGRGAVPTFSPKFPSASKRSFYTVRADGTLTVNRKWHTNAGPLAIQVRDEFVNRLKAAGLDIKNLPYPSVPINAWGPKVEVLIQAVSAILGRPHDSGPEAAEPRPGQGGTPIEG
jgi:hypothetical protein